MNWANLSLSSHVLLQRQDVLVCFFQDGWGIDFHFLSVGSDFPFYFRTLLGEFSFSAFSAFSWLDLLTFSAARAGVVYVFCLRNLTGGPVRKRAGRRQNGSDGKTVKR